MPSSPIRTLPRPSTSVFTRPVVSSLFVVTLLPLKLPSAYDRGYRAAPLNVVVIKGKIHMNNDEGDKEPKECVVPEAHAELPAHQRNDPGKHPRQPRVAHAGVEREAGDGLEDKRQEREEVNHAGQRVVPRRDRPVQ